jgi:hypothetical protein
MSKSTSRRAWRGPSPARPGPRSRSRPIPRLLAGSALAGCRHGLLHLPGRRRVTAPPFRFAAGGAALGPSHRRHRPLRAPLMHDLIRTALAPLVRFVDPGQSRPGSSQARPGLEQILISTGSPPESCGIRSPGHGRPAAFGRCPPHVAMTSSSGPGWTVWSGPRTVPTTGPSRQRHLSESSRRGQRGNRVVDPGPVDDIGQAALQTAHRLFMALPGCPFAPVVGPARAVVPDLGQGHGVQRVVELAVAGA